MRLLLIYLTVSVVILSCQSKTPPQTEDQYFQEIESWHQERVSELKGTYGFLNIVGLQALKLGSNGFGGSEENDVYFDLMDLPKNIGIFSLVQDEVYFEPLIDSVLWNGKTIQHKIKVLEKGKQESAYFYYGNYFWNVIKRHAFYGVRIREKEAKNVANFAGIERFPVDLAWRIEGEFIPYEPAKSVQVPNIFGENNLQDSPGFVQFSKEGKIFTLDVLEGNEEKYFIIFSDHTSGQETYGGGRYLYVRKPDKAGKMVIDFNQAYNPPCVYTPFATCPLTPKQNILDLSVWAGEFSKPK
jgi:uncharacterized protein